MGDLLCVLLFIWAECCVVSHYQNLRDGVREDLVVARWTTDGGEGFIITQQLQQPQQQQQQQPPPGYEAAQYQLPSNMSVDISSDADLPPPYPGNNEARTEAEADKVIAPPSYDDCVRGEQQQQEQQQQLEQQNEPQQQQQESQQQQQRQREPQQQPQEQQLQQQQPQEQQLQQQQPQDQEEEQQETDATETQSEIATT